MKRFINVISGLIVLLMTVACLEEDDTDDSIDTDDWGFTSKGLKSVEYRDQKKRPDMTIRLRRG